MSQIYLDNGEIFMPCLIQLGNSKFSNNYANDIANEKDKNFGYTHNINFKNINVYNENPLNVRARFQSVSNEVFVEDIVIENLFINGERISDFNSLDLFFENNKNITIK